MRRIGTLLLSDGSKYQGEVIGADVQVSGEVVFNTAMTGYTESLTDPSIRWSDSCHHLPHYGQLRLSSEEVNPETGLTKYSESDKLHPIALIMHDYT